MFTRMCKLVLFPFWKPSSAHLSHCLSCFQIMKPNILSITGAGAFAYLAGLTIAVPATLDQRDQGPAAHCYDASNGVPPPDISDRYVNECGHKDLWFLGSDYNGWTVYYDRTDYDLGQNVVTSCRFVELKNRLSVKEGAFR